MEPSQICHTVKLSFELHCIDKTVQTFAAMLHGQTELCIAQTRLLKLLGVLQAEQEPLLQ